MRPFALFAAWACVASAVAATDALAGSASARSGIPRSGSRLSRPVSFDETFERYPSPYAVIRQLQRIAPGWENAGYQPCLQLDERSAPLVGTIDPLQLAPLEQEPGALFYKFYAGCVRTLVSATLGGSSYLASAEAVLGAELNQVFDRWARCEPSDATPADDERCERFRRGPFPSPWSPWTQARWTEIPPELRSALLRRFALYLVGPNSVLLAKGYYGPRNAFRADLPTADALFEMLDRRLSALSNGLLSAAGAYAETAVLLRLGPALRN